METFHYHLNLLLLHIQGWKHALSMSNRKSDHWALFSKSVLDRTRLALASKAEWCQNVLQPSAEYLGSLLGVDQWAVCLNCLKVNLFPPYSRLFVYPPSLSLIAVEHIH